MSKVITFIALQHHPFAFLGKASQQTFSQPSNHPTVALAVAIL